MAVVCVQSVEGAPDQRWVIEPHSPEQTDAELLRVKAQGADDKGWAVEWDSPSSFTARKVRWENQSEVTRTFWVE